jgi:hypothetical protein
MAAVPGGPDALYANASVRSRIRSAGRRLGGTDTFTEDTTGKRVLAWNGVPILDIGSKADGTLIIPQTETQGTSNIASSIYAVKFGRGEGDQAVTGLTNGGVMVDDLGLLQSQPVYRTRDRVLLRPGGVRAGRGPADRRPRLLNPTFDPATHRRSSHDMAVTNARGGKGPPARRPRLAATRTSAAAPADSGAESGTVAPAATGAFATEAPTGKTRTDDNVNKPSTVFPGEAPADTLDPNERVSTVPHQPDEEALRVGTVNAVLVNPALPTAAEVARNRRRGGNERREDRVETYEATRRTARRSPSRTTSTPARRPPDLVLASTVGEGTRDDRAGDRHGRSDAHDAPPLHGRAGRGRRP